MWVRVCVCSKVIRACLCVYVFSATLIKDTAWRKDKFENKKDKKVCVCVCVCVCVSDDIHKSVLVCVRVLKGFEQG